MWKGVQQTMNTNMLAITMPTVLLFSSDISSALDRVQTTQVEQKTTISSGTAKPKSSSVKRNSNWSGLSLHLSQQVQSLSGWFSLMNTALIVNTTVHISKHTTEAITFFHLHELTCMGKITARNRWMLMLTDVRMLLYMLM